MPSHTISAHKTIAKWNNATTIDSNPPAEKLANGSAYPGCAGAIPDCDTEDCGTWRSYLQDAVDGFVFRAITRSSASCFLLKSSIVPDAKN